MTQVALKSDQDRQGQPASPALGRQGRVLGMPPLIALLFGVALALGLLNLVRPEIHEHVHPFGFLTYLSLGGEVNLGTWFSILQLALLGGTLLVFAWTQIRRGARAAWVLVLGAGLFLTMSIDEQLMLHEHYGGKLAAMAGTKDAAGDAMNKTGTWVFVVVPLFLLIVAALAVPAWTYLRGRPRVIAKYAIGFTGFVLAAGGLEAVGNFAPGGRIENLIVTIEEVLEMASITLILWATLDLMAAHGVRIRVDAGEPAQRPA